MRLYPKEAIDELKSKIRIEEEIARYVNLEKKGDKYVGLCPFHEDKNPSLFVYPETGSYYCFGCGAKGDVISFVRNAENTDFNSTVRLIAERNGITLNESADDPTRSILEANAKARNYYSRLLYDEKIGRGAMEYLRERGITDETVKKFSLGFASNDSRGFIGAMRREYVGVKTLVDAGLVWETDNGSAGNGKVKAHRCWFYNRLMIPIKNENGSVVGFGGRQIGENGHGPKYINSTETAAFQKSRVLFAIDLAKNSKKDDFILCEGYFDAIHLHQHGFDNAIATMGVSLTAEHAKIIKKYKSRVTICYDSDSAGCLGAGRAAEILKKEGIKVNVISNLGGYKDIDEALRRDPEAVRLLFKQKEEQTMITTSHEAAKLLKKLNEDYAVLLKKEKKSSVFRAAMGEDPETVRPAYDYAATRDELDIIEGKIRRLKHAINVFNTTHTVPGYDMTVDEMLVRLPLLSGKKQKLAEMISKLPKERVEPEYVRMVNIIDYNYINYDLDAVKADYEKVCAELADSQLALDTVNARETFEVDL